MHNTSPESRSPTLEPEVRRELSRRARPGAGIYALCVGLIAVFTDLAHRYPWIYGASFAALTVLGFARLAICSRVVDSPRWDRAFAAVCTATALIWGGMVGLLVWWDGLQGSTFLLLIASTGLCSGATSAFAPALRLLRVIQAAMMIPVLLGVFGVGTREAFGAGVFCALYAGYLVGQGTTLSSGYTQGLNSRLSLQAQSQQLEEARRAAEKANRVKGEFLANVSHELRTPLNGVVGMTEEVLTTRLTDSQREDLGVVRESAISLLAVINQILDFSRIEAGQLPQPLQERFSLDGLLARVLRTFSRDAAQKGLWLFYSVAPEVPVHQIGDPHRLRQILNNLVGNSLKFTPRGHVLIKASRGPRGLVLEVVDTGIGIPSGQLETLFEPFTQADNSLTRTHQGTGLGLSIVRQLVRSLGGEVEVRSHPEQGTTFRFECAVSHAEEGPNHPLIGMAFRIHDEIEERANLLASLIQRWGGEVRPGGLEQGDEIHLFDGESPPDLVAGASGVRLYRGATPRSSLGGMRQLHSPPGPEELANCLRPKSPTPELVSGTAADGCRVLLVEDQAVNAELVRRILERAGHRVTLAQNGSEALEIFARERPDLILMDVQMPVMDGFEATARLRELPGGSSVPIIALTAHAVAGDVERCLAAGMDAYLSKPISRVQLMGLIEQVAGPRQEKV